MPQVHPSQITNNAESMKSSALRGEACLGGDAAGGSYVGAHADGTAAEWSQRSEFDLLLDFLDTDGNGKISALELADFVDSLLGTQDHKRPNGSIVFEAVLTAALCHTSPEEDGKDAAPHEGGPNSLRPGRRPPPPPAPLPPPPLSIKADSGKWTSGRSETEETAATTTASKQQQLQEKMSHHQQEQQQQPQQQQQQFPPSRPSPASQHQLQGSVTGQLGTILGGAVSMKEVHQYGSSRFLTMDAVRKCFADILADTELWIRMTRSCSVMTTTLFRQLLMYSAEKLERKFSMMVFLRTYAAFNALPLWLPFPMLWRNRKNGILFLVYLHQLTKLQNQLGPWISSRVPLHATLVVLTMLQFTATYVPLIAFIAAHGIPAMGSSKSIVGFMHANPLPKQVSLFGSILPWAVLQFLTSSASLKLSCRDFVSLKEQCKAVFMLGDVSTEFEGYRGLTVREVMDSIKSRVELTISRSAYRRLNALMPLIFSISLETFRRLVRLFLVRNLVAREVLGKAVAPFEVYALVYNIWFAYSESADCTAYLYKLRKVSSIFKTLLSKEESLSQSLPWLNNHSPRNILLWSRLRRYYQSPNCLELRWIEMHLTLVVLAAIGVTIILVVTFVQKTLLRFHPENADLQLFVVWVIPAFIYLLLALVIDVVMSASTGVEYHDGVMTLSAEAVFIADRLNSAQEIAFRYGDGDEGQETGRTADGGAVDSDDDRILAATATATAAPACRKPPVAPLAATRGPSSESGIVRRLTGAPSGAFSGGDERESTSDLSKDDGGGGAVVQRRNSSFNSRRLGSGALDAIGGGFGAASVGGCGRGFDGGWVPAPHFRLSRAERSRLKQCQEVIKSLVTYIQFNAEYITIFGVPIDTHLRNTLFSVSITLVGAGISAFLAIVVKRQ